jgi:hypothetical protein
MDPVVVTIVVEDIDVVLNFFDKIKVYRSTTGEGGTYTEITTPANRPTLLPLKKIYEFVDTAGDEAYFYKTSYFNSTTLVEGSLSDAAQGDSEPALSILTPQELQDFYLFGLDLTNDEGEPYPDTLYRFYIKYGVDRLEKELDVDLVARSHFETHDFIKQDYYEFLWLQMDHQPVLSIESVELILPNDQKVITFDPSWFKTLNEASQLQILPGNGQLATIALGSTGAWLPFLYGGGDFLPNVFHINYTAGFPKGKVPTVLKEMVGKMASFGPLNIAGDLLGGAGIASQSISLDGLSQSFNTTSSATNAGYGARLGQYEKEIKAAMPKLRSYFHPVALHVG